MEKTLIYVHDPMCSWCYAFEPVRRSLFDALAGRVPIRRLLGGLAPDADEPMPESMRDLLQQTWRRIEQVVPGTRFNFDFWRQCQPRRSTYPSNRAVIAARAQGEAWDTAMTARIQRAYYLEARNPSDTATLIELARDIGLDAERFSGDLVAPATQAQLMREIDRARMLGIHGFPALAVVGDAGLRHIGLNYTDSEALLHEVLAA